MNLIRIVSMFLAVTLASSSRADIIPIPTQVDVEASMDPLPNRVTLLAGIGPDGLNTRTIKNGGVDIQPYYGPLVGAAYSRAAVDRWSATVGFLVGATPETRTLIGFGGLGWSW